MFDKVLFVAPNYKKRKGGISSVLKTYSNNIDKFNFHSSISYQNIYLNMLFFPVSILQFIWRLSFNKPLEIIHIHGASRGSFLRKHIFISLSKAFKKKVVYHIHGGEYHLFYNESSSLLKKRIKRVIKNSDALVVLSNEWKDYFSKEFNKEEIYVINNIIEFKNILTRKRENNFIQFIFLGRIGKGKGIFDVLEALKNIKNDINTKFILRIGGDGEVQKLKEYLSKYKLNDLVEYIGWISGDDKKKYLESSDIMIMPSYNEGLPISLLEAMSYTMPIISTSVGGIPQILKDNFNGKIVEPGSISQIEKVILYYIQNPEKINIHGKNSYDLVTNFFPEKVMIDLSHIYKLLLK